MITGEFYDGLPEEHVDVLVREDDESHEVRLTTSRGTMFGGNSRNFKLSIPSINVYDSYDFPPDAVRIIRDRCNEFLEALT